MKIKRYACLKVYNYLNVEQRTDCFTAFCCVAVSVLRWLACDLSCIGLDCIGLDKNQRKIVGIFLQIIFSISFGCSKELFFLSTKSLSIRIWSLSEVKAF